MQIFGKRYDAMSDVDEFSEASGVFVAVMAERISPCG